MADDRFAQLVSLACHDLRTPLATVSGFAKTLTRMEEVDERLHRYLEMIDAASDQLAALLDDLALVSRVEAGRWEPVVREADTLVLAQAAAAQLDGAGDADGTGAPVGVDPEVAERALYSLARCALRHGGLERVAIRADGPSVRIGPVVEAAQICLGEDLRDLGSAVAVRMLAALGGTAEIEGDALVVRLPLAPVVS